MKKLLMLFTASYLFFIAPIIPAGLHTIAYAATGGAAASGKAPPCTGTDHVDGDYACGMDAAKIDGEVNIDSTIGTETTGKLSEVVRRTVGGIQKVTTNSTDQQYLNMMYKESLVYGADTMLAYIYTTPPASTYAFVQDMGQSLGFIPKHAYAQGYGFNGLMPLLPIWRAFRNIAYLLLAIFMIVIGFLIMFRKKIDPKTVITVQNALPNIVITLLLITFSYAIVGVLIDFMYVIIALTANVLQSISGGALPKDIAKEFVTANAGTLLSRFGMAGLSSVNDVASMFGPWTIEIGAGIPATIAILGAFITGPGALLVAGAPLLLIVLIALAFVIAIIRLFFLLISAYIQIILALLVSPFQLLLGVFPGNHAFENWIKNLIANLAVFPITAVMLLVGIILTKGTYEGTLWTPPFLEPAGSWEGGGMGGVIGLGILFAIPSVAGSIKEALKAKPMVAAGPGAVIGPLGGATGQGMQALYQISMIKNMFPQKKEGTQHP